MIIIFFSRSEGHVFAELRVSFKNFFFLEISESFSKFLRSSHRRYSIKKKFLKLLKITEKYLRWSLFFDKIKMFLATGQPILCHRFPSTPTVTIR